MGKDQALIPTSENTYDYTWVDKDDPRACQTHYLIDEGHVGDTADGGTHDNLLITGDSGDVLEALTRVPELADKYVGRVKCVYIDPPFNTGGVFTNYEDNLEHSVWLTFMRDRLVLLKRLLAEDGSIWVHLDDSENHRMRMLMDEVFGAGNFVSEVVWEKNDSPKMSDQGVSTTHDSIIAFRINSAWTPNAFEVEAKEYEFPKIDSDGRRYSSRELRKWGSNSLRSDRPTMWYPIMAPDGRQVWPVRPDGREGRWRWEPSTVKENYERLEWLEMPEPVGLTPYVKSYLEEGKKPKPPKSLWTSREVGGNSTAKEQIKNLFPGITPFDTPKPEQLLERILTIATNPGDLVLDCFAGSGTTAAVAHKMGRRWVTVELLPETVAAFTRPRLEKVVSGEDRGGISTSKERVAVEGTELPENTTPEAAQAFSSTLGKFADTVELPTDVMKLASSQLRAAAKQGADTGLDTDEQAMLLKLLRKASLPEHDLGPEAVKQLRRAARTRDEVTVHWHGGGGFDVATLSPVWVGTELDELTGEVFTYITEAATGDVLERSIAGHLGFYLTDDDPRLVGVKGRQYLAVIEGVVSEEKAEELTAALPKGAAVTIVCDGAPEGLSRSLQKQAKGSRILVMPDDLFTYSPSTEGAR